MRGTFTSLASLCFVAILSVVSVQPAQASPLNLPAPLCNKLDFRKEWRALSVAERKSYIDSVLCLMDKPPNNPDSAAHNRFEEFQESHIALTPRIHVVGQFLPWHRHIVTLYTNELRDQCGYTGPTPYWDWTIDADSSTPLAQSPIFDPVTGFGGDGVPGTYTLPDDPDGINNTPGEPINPAWWKGCVQDGPFKDRVFHLGPRLLKTDHCLVRGFTEHIAKPWIDTESVQYTLNLPTFEDFIASIDNSRGGSHAIHHGGHLIVGGEMGDGYSSPGDPIFYLHHANLDRVWWQWQMANPLQRLYKIGGFTEYFGTHFGTTPTTLDYVLDFPGISHNVTIQQVMNTLFEPNCFVYL